MNAEIPLSPAIPAASLILLREGAGRIPEILMIERASGMAFAAGALAFPGGRVDPADLALAEDEEAASRIAAIRETIEEVGIAVGIVPDEDAVARLRRDRDFAVSVAGGLRLDLSALVPFARWVPNHRVSRRFDTRFYLAVAAPDTEPLVDGGECSDAFWATAHAILADAAAGHHALMTPTRMNLQRLATLPTIDAIFAHARALPVGEPIASWVEDRDGEPWVCIPDGMGYPVTAEPLALMRRT